MLCMLECARASLIPLDAAAGVRLCWRAFALEVDWQDTACPRRARVS